MCFFNSFDSLSTPQKSLEVTKDLFSLNPTVSLLLMLRRCKIQGDLSLPLWLAYTNVYTKKTTENLSSDLQSIK